MNRQDQSEREHGRARSTPAGSVEPRRGGSVVLPGQSGSGLLFSVDVKSLASETDAAQPGWCVRMSMPELRNAALVGVERSILSLLAEVRFSSGGVESVIEIDAFPGFSLHLAADTVSAKLKWADGVLMEVPPAGNLTWQLTRGFCPTTATRSFHIDPNADPAPSLMGDVPLFATHFALYSPDDLNPLLDGGFSGVELYFATGQGGAVVHAYKGDALIGTVGEFSPIPQGGRAWVFPYALPVDPSTGQIRIQLVFAYGALVS